MSITPPPSPSRFRISITHSIMYAHTSNGTCTIHAIVEGIDFRLQPSSSIDNTFCSGICAAPMNSISVID